MPVEPELRTLLLGGLVGGLLGGAYFFLHGYGFWSVIVAYVLFGKLSLFATGFVIALRVPKKVGCEQHVDSNQ